ncbi:hypothetical protein LCGC14_1926820, partial [marine sediment metagenome]
MFHYAVYQTSDDREIIVESVSLLGVLVLLSER